MRLLRRPLVWLLLFAVGWLVLIIVEIALGMGGTPGGGGAP